MFIGSRMMMSKVAGVTYATWNPADKSPNVTLSNGNLTMATANANNEPARATLGKSSGKWYWEVIGSNNIGIAQITTSVASGNYPGVDTVSYGYNFTANKYNNATGSAYGVTFSATDVMGIALDMDAGTITFYKNNVSQGVAFSGLSGTFYPMDTVQTASSFTPSTANFGATALTYSPPAGFNAGLYQ